MDRIRDLCDLARDVDESPESLIRFGAIGELTIYVIAHDWPVRSNSDTKDTLKGSGILAGRRLTSEPERASHNGQSGTAPK